MPVKNEFSELLRELIHHSGIKNQSIADAVGYDLSYISKWLGGKMLPSERTIDATVQAISQCISDSLNDLNRDWFAAKYHENQNGLIQKSIRQELLNAYTDSKGKSNNKTSVFYSFLSSKIFYESIYNLIEESESAVVVVDLFALDRESRQAFIGMQNGYYTKKKYEPEKRMVLLFCASQYCNPSYDAISLIHLITVFSLYDFSLFNSRFAVGKTIAACSDKLMSGMIMEESEKVFAVSITENMEDGLKTKRELVQMAQNKDLVYSQKSMIDFTNDKDYLKSMLSTNIKWIQGHITELIMPDALYEKLFDKIGLINFDEAQRVHLFAKNIIEQESTRILLYETALSDLIATGEVDFFNNKVMLSPKEIQDYIQFLINLVEKNNIYIIGGPLFSEFKHAFSPCLYISDTICYVRIENAYNRENIFEIIDKDVKELFGKLYLNIISSRDDVVIKKKNVIMERLENYKKMAGITENLKI